MTSRSFLITVITFLFATTAFASRTVAQADVYRDEQEFETRRAALNRVGENRDTASRYRRHVASSRHLIELKRLSAINVAMTQAASQGAPLDYKFLAKSAAEINRRAKRLQTDLRFAKTKEHDVRKAESNPGDLRGSLEMLQSSITSFADNSIFKNPRVADINLSIKAAGDLEKIIELSGEVERVCKKLSSSNP